MPSARAPASRWARRYKGLRTSSAALAKDYFRDLGRNTVVLRHTGAESAEALDLFFNKKRADDRKAFLTEHYDPAAHVDYAADEVPVERFVRDELLPQYAMASVHRAIPSALDGFKVSTRKIFFGARALKMYDDISVANAAGKIASHTNYHHRGTALEDALVGMAADYAGASNLNLFLPHGQFGTRHNHEAASAAYPKTCLDAPLHALHVSPADDPLLEHVVDEGAPVEPVHYLPVIATALCFGVKGIATGWSTEGPMYDPLEVLAAARAWLDGGGGGDLPEMTPWYRGFGGTVTRDPGSEPAADGARRLRAARPRRARDGAAPLQGDGRGGGGVAQARGRGGRRGARRARHRHHRAPGAARRARGVRRGGDPRPREARHPAEPAPARRGRHAAALHRPARRDPRARGGAAGALPGAARPPGARAGARGARAARPRGPSMRAVLEDRFDPRRHAGEEEAAAALHALLSPEVAEPIDDAALLKMPFGSLTTRRVEELRRRVAATERELEELRACTPERAWRADLDALERHLRAGARA